MVTTRWGRRKSRGSAARPEDPNPWDDCAARIAALGLPGPDQLAAYQVLVWLAGERVATPTDIRLGTDSRLTLGWRQGEYAFGICLAPNRRIKWWAECDGTRTAEGRRLDQAASSALRLNVPIVGRVPAPAVDPAEATDPPPSPDFGGDFFI
jgi:hypothetical protein